MPCGLDDACLVEARRFVPARFRWDIEPTRLAFLHACGADIDIKVVASIEFALRIEDDCGVLANRFARHRIGGVYPDNRSRANSVVFCHEELMLTLGQ